MNTLKGIKSGNQGNPKENIEIAAVRRKQSGNLGQAHVTWIEKIVGCAKHKVPQWHALRPIDPKLRQTTDCTCHSPVGQDPLRIPSLGPGGRPRLEHAGISIEIRQLQGLKK
jgi:hypothetical protein